MADHSEFALKITESREEYPPPGDREEIVATDLASLNPEYG